VMLILALRANILRAPKFRHFLWSEAAPGTLGLGGRRGVAGAAVTRMTVRSRVTVQRYRYFSNSQYDRSDRLPSGRVCKARRKPHNATADPNEPGRTICAEARPARGRNLCH
jgi:hypothetical protein